MLMKVPENSVYLGAIVIDEIMAFGMFETIRHNFYLFIIQIIISLP